MRFENQDFKHIVSRDNAVFKQLKKLADNARERRLAGKTLLDGAHLIEAYLQAFGRPESAGLELIIIPEGKSSHEATHLMQTLVDVKTVMLPTLMFSELTPVASSTGILALVAIPTAKPQLAIPKQINFALMLEDIQDPGNLGSMLRTAAAAGVNVVYLSKGCTDAWSPKALRGGQGAQFIVPMFENADLIAELKIFDGNSFATTLHGESLYAQDLSLPTVFVIGNEGAGLSDTVCKATTHQISIPMHSSVESLNAAAAAAICLFERTRQAIV